jgi:hypothetical protein
MGIARNSLPLIVKGIASFLFIYIIIMGIAKIPLPLIVKGIAPFLFIDILQ